MEFSGAGRVNSEALPDFLRDNIGYLLNRNARTLKEWMTLALAEVDLGFHEYVVLRMLEMELAASQQDIGRLSGIDRTSMVALLDRLEARALIIRSRDLQDRRKHKLSLTPRGRKTLTHAKRIAGKVHQRFIAPLTPEEWQGLKGCLEKLILGSGESIL